jgi:Protein of unknown function (DUF3574)
MYHLRSFFVGIVLLAGLGFGTAQARDSDAARTYAPHSERALCKHVGGDVFIRTELFFGLSRTGAPDISEQEFQNFVDTQVTPRFPDGLTLLSGKGQFRSAAGSIVQEGSKLLILLYPFSGKRTADVDAIRTQYKAMFQQESVLRVDEQSCVSF